MRKTKTLIAFSVIGLTSLQAHAGAEQSFDVADFTRVAAAQGIEVNSTRNMRG